MSLIYETFVSAPCDLSEARQFAVAVKKQFPETELAVDEPFAGKLVTTVAPSVDCYSAEAGSYRVEVYGPHDSHDVMQAVDWNLPQYQSLKHGFGASAPLSYIRLGVNYTGTGVSPRYKAKSWQPSIEIALNFDVVCSEDRARKLAELIGLAGFEPPKAILENGTAYLQLPDKAHYSVDGMRPDLHTASMTADPDSISISLPGDADKILSLAEKLQVELDASEPVSSIFAFNAEEADDYQKLRDRFGLAVAEESVWQVKPRKPLLSKQARQALASDADAEHLDVLPLLEIGEKGKMHPVSLVRKGKQWRIVVGTYQVNQKSDLQDLLTPFVNGWASIVEQ